MYESGTENRKFRNLQGGHRLVVIMTLLESIRYRKHIGFAEGLANHLQTDGQSAFSEAAGDGNCRQAS